jgi:hypothetical protein
VELRDAPGRRPVTPEKRVAIEEAIQRIEELVDRDDDATAAIETLNETTGHNFGLDDLHHRCRAPDREQLIEWACAPPPVRLPRRHPRRADRDRASHPRRPDRRLVHRGVRAQHVMPGASGLTFHPPPELRDMTAEEIVDAALAYYPTAL